MFQVKEHTPVPSLSTIFTFGLVVEFIKKFGGASPAPLPKQKQMQALDDDEMESCFKIDLRDVL
jgi:hypothetical protein